MGVRRLPLLNVKIFYKSRLVEDVGDIKLFKIHSVMVLAWVLLLFLRGSRSLGEDERSAPSDTKELDYYFLSSITWEYRYEI
jgi:hypothetical protein